MVASSETASSKIAFSELEQATTLSDIFNPGAMDNFEAYMGEKVHGNQDEPDSAKEAGRIDAQKSPPFPEGISATPSGYLRDLFQHADVFFQAYKKRCVSLFNEKCRALKKALHTTKSEKIEFDKLGEYTKHLIDEKEGFEKYKKKITLHAGLEPIVWGTKISGANFGITILMIASLEMAIVWYLLSDQLGYSASIFAAGLATSFVAIVASLGAFSHANTSKDLSPVRQTLGYIFMIITGLLFLFGIGLLSGWRADSTSTGFSIVIEGYKSMTQIDILVSAVANIGGFVWLLFKIRRYFWSKFMKYSEWVSRIESLEKEVSAEKQRIEQEIEAAYNSGMNNIQNLEASMHEITDIKQGHSNMLNDAATKLANIVEGYFEDYVEENKANRTLAIYPSPNWFSKCSFKVKSIQLDEVAAKELDDQFNVINDELISFIKSKKIELEKSYNDNQQNLNDNQQKLRGICEGGIIDE